VRVYESVFSFRPPRPAAPVQPAPPKPPIVAAARPQFLAPACLHHGQPDDEPGAEHSPARCVAAVSRRRFWPCKGFKRSGRLIDSPNPECWPKLFRPSAVPNRTGQRYARGWPSGMPGAFVLDAQFPAITLGPGRTPHHDLCRAGGLKGNARLPIKFRNTCTSRSSTAQNRQGPLGGAMTSQLRVVVLLPRGPRPVPARVRQDRQPRSTASTITRDSSASSREASLTSADQPVQPHHVLRDDRQQLSAAGPGPRSRSRVSIALTDRGTAGSWISCATGRRQNRSRSRPSVPTSAGRAGGPTAPRPSAPTSSRRRRSSRLGETLAGRSGRRPSSAHYRRPASANRRIGTGESSANRYQDSSTVSARARAKQRQDRRPPPLVTGLSSTSPRLPRQRG